LPPGYYDVNQDMRGLYFKKRNMKTENLLRFPDASSDAVIEEISKFWGLEKKFDESSIPYKRGMILYGPPGSGKTCTLQIVIENLTKNHKGIVVEFPGVHLFKEGYDVLRQIHQDMPVIILMEDIDAILNRNSESEVLNILDGMNSIRKTIFLATTNYPEKLGSRIMNRPSRFDKKIFIGMPSSEAREIYIKSKLIDESEEEVGKWVEDTNGMSIAHIKELYVANKIIGDTYSEALKTVKSMKVTPGSSTFDDYHIRENGERKLKRRFGKVWDRYGSGDMYAEAKKKAAAGLITEDWAGPDQIAGLI
jgi:SpoVK/Ycf46/Vps4 family AAA+-type ATPase